MARPKVAIYTVYDSDSISLFASQSQRRSDRPGLILTDSMSCHVICEWKYVPPELMIRSYSMMPIDTTLVGARGMALWDRIERLVQSVLPLQTSWHDSCAIPLTRSADIWVSLWGAGTNFCFKKCVAVIAMQLEDCIALSAVCVAVSFCMLWGLKCERPATDYIIMKNTNANIQYFAVLMTTWQVLNKIYVENKINVSSW